MHTTYKLFSGLYNKDLEKMNDKDVCNIYKETQRPDIIATYYCIYMNAIVFWHNKYNLKDESQTASIALECLNYCLSNFDGSSTFKTYFNNGLKVRLLSQKQYEMSKKRNCGLTIDVDSVEIEKNEEEFEKIKLYDLMLNSNLTNLQLEYCNYYMTTENSSDADFCRKHKVNHRKLDIMKLSLQNKLSYIYN